MNDEDRETIDDLLDEATVVHDTSDVNGLPESPNSANVKIWINGFGTMFTMRDNKMANVVKKVKTLIQLAQENGWKSTWDTNVPLKTTTVPQKEEYLGNCKDCGAPNKLSIRGKKYCSAKCWLSGDATDGKDYKGRPY